MVEINSNTFEITVLGDVTVGERVVRKDAEYKKTVLTSEILSIQEVFNRKGEVRITRCAMDLRDGTRVITKGSYDSIKQVLYRPDRKIGY